MSDEERRTWEHVPPERHFHGRADELGPASLGSPELNGDDFMERRARRLRRQRYETWRARAIIAGSLLAAVALFVGHTASSAAIILVTFLVSLDLRRRGQ